MNYATLTQLAATDPLPLTLGARRPRAEEALKPVLTPPPRRVGNHWVNEGADGKLSVWPAVCASDGTFYVGNLMTRADREALGVVGTLRKAPRDYAALPAAACDDSLDATGVYEAMLKAPL